MSIPLAVDHARAPRPLVRQRDFRLLWAGDTVSAIGDAVTLIALPLVALESLHASISATAGLTGMPYVPVLLLGLPVGAWVDRLPRRPVLLVSSLVAALAIGSVPAAAAAGVLTFAHLIVVSLLLGACRFVTQTAAAAYLPEVVPRGQLTEPAILTTCIRRSWQQPVHPVPYDAASCCFAGLVPRMKCADGVTTGRVRRTRAKGSANSRTSCLGPERAPVVALDRVAHRPIL